MDMQESRCLIAILNEGPTCNSCAYLGKYSNERIIF
jgi:hypothetical protein